MPSPLFSYEELDDLTLLRVETENPSPLHEVEVSPVSGHGQPAGVGQLGHQPRLGHRTQLGQAGGLVLLGRVLRQQTGDTQ